MTNAEFEKKLRQECENNEELSEEINEITGISEEQSQRPILISPIEMNFITKLTIC